MNLPAASDPVPLVFASATQRGAAKYSNLIGLPLLVAAFGAGHLVRRRRRTRQSYRRLVPVSEGAP